MAGGGIYNNGTMTVNQCTLSGNSDGKGGGGIGNDGTLTLFNSIVAGNTAGLYRVRIYIIWLIV